MNNNIDYITDYIKDTNHEKTYNVLLRDDHPLIIDCFKNALNYVSNENEAIHFRIQQATNCETAYHKIKMFVPTQRLDLVILDISLPPCAKLNLHTGEDLGALLRQLLPGTLIMVCTFTDPSRLHQILKRIKPKGFMVKSDIDHMGLTPAIKEVLANNTETIKTMLRQKAVNDISLDAIDILILKELANAAKMNELIQLVPLSKSAILKRIKNLKIKFGIENGSSRDLVLMAKSKGFI